MAHHKSAIKRIRQNEKKRLRNRHVTSNMRTAIKKFEQALADNAGADIKALLQKTISIVDRAATRGVIHPNKASRTVSRLTQRVNRLAQ